MKTLLIAAAAALAFATPAIAQPVQAHQGHQQGSAPAQHQGHGQQDHAQHQGSHAQHHGNHAQHGQAGGGDHSQHANCCGDADGNGRMDCCEGDSAAQRPCCAQHQQPGAQTPAQPQNQ